MSTTPQQIAVTLARIVEPNCTVEMRLLFDVRPPIIGHFKADADGLGRLAGDALSWGDDFRGAYFMMNPLPENWGGGTAKDVDIVRRRVMLIDCDPVREGTVSSTDAEKKLARDKACAVAEFLTELGFPLPIIADSGNGSHLLYRVDEPADDGGLVARCLKALDRQFSDDAVSVDTKVGNASRICKIYGTVGRKGPNTPERPWRVSSVGSIPDGWESAIVPTKLLEELASSCKPASTGVALPMPTVNASCGGPIDPDRVERASKYLAKMDASVSGQNGHGKLLKAASVLVNDFGMSDEDAATLLALEFNGRCVPPWPEKELLRKCSEARKATVSREPKAEGKKAREQPFTLAGQSSPVAFDASAQFQPFPVDALPSSLAEFVTAGAAAIGCDPSFLALPILSVCSAAIGNAARVKVKAGWNAPPIIWSMIVGDSGTSKTPAFRLVMAPVRARQHEALRDHVAVEKEHGIRLALHKKKLAMWEREKNTSDIAPEKPAEPVAKRFAVSDTTLEAVAPLLAGNPRGLLLGVDELSGWFGSFDRYSGGGGDSAAWLSMFNGETLTIDRKTGTPRTISVPNAAVCITGGIQPSILRKALGSEHRESGMAARFLLANPPRKAKQWTDAEISPIDEARYSAVVNALYDLPMAGESEGEPRPHVIGFDARARAAYVEWFNAHALEQAELTGDLAAAWSKLEEYVPRLALIFHLVRFVSDDATLTGQGEIDAATMSSAIRVVEWCKHEAKRVYGMLSESDEDSEQRKLVEFIRRKGGSVTASEVQSGVFSLRGPGLAKKAIEMLVEAGDGRWEVVGKSQRFALNC